MFMEMPRKPISHCTIIIIVDMDRYEWWFSPSLPLVSCQPKPPPWPMTLIVIIELFKSINIVIFVLDQLELRNAECGWTCTDWTKTWLLSNLVAARGILWNPPHAHFRSNHHYVRIDGRLLNRLFVFLISMSIVWFAGKRCTSHKVPDVDRSHTFIGSKSRNAQTQDSNWK